MNASYMHIISYSYIQFDYSTKGTRYSRQDLDRMYNEANKNTINWGTVLSDQTNEYFDLLEEGYNTPKSLTIGSLLTLTSALVGKPNSITSKNRYWLYILHCT